MGSWLLQLTVLALGCKLTYIYAENIYTQAAFGIISLHLGFLAVVTTNARLAK
jgi:hypothetical protein